MFRKYPKIAATFLLLVFTQQAGLRLWMHDWFHESKTAQTRLFQHASHVQLKCNCFDDAMMPLLGSPTFTIPPPIRVYATLTAPDQSPILSAEKIFYSLKGPPMDPSTNLLA